MPDKPTNNRPQLNIRLDKHPDLLDSIKQAASDGYAGTIHRPSLHLSALERYLEVSDDQKRQAIAKLIF